MTISEVVVSALILGISSQVSLRGWSTTTAAAVAVERRDQQLQAMDQRLLASERLLAIGQPVDGACRFWLPSLQQILDQRPVDPALSEQLELAPDHQGVWLTLQAHGLDPAPQRRRLFTPAGLGLCRDEAVG